MLEQFWERHRHWLRLLPWAALVFVFAAGLFGNHGIFRLHQLKEERASLESSIRVLDRTNHQLKREVRDLRTDPTYLEKLAREELGLVKPGEVVYQFAEPSPGVEREPVGAVGDPD